VYIEHADGTQAWYLHMKQNSLTSKNVGDAVAVGEFLGIVGSSGPSTMPHLHFEVYDSLGNLIDPYAGPCNALNPTSWWQDQPDYFDPAVNALMTHSAPPVFPPCPQQEILNEQIEFPAVSPVVYFAGYYRDQLAGLESQYRIYRPNNSLFQFWSHSSPNYLRASYSYWVFNLGAAPPTGIWRFEVTFNGVTTSHRFGVGTSVTDAGLFSGLDEIRLANSPNPMLGATTIHFNLPQPGPVELSIYGVNGAKVRGLMNSQSPTRTGSVAWDGRDDAGRNVGSGTYFYRLQSGSIDETRKMIMVR
jgi:hypothetical protein